MSLLTEAKNVDPPRIWKKIDPTNEQIEVMVAFLTGEISIKAAAVVLNIPSRRLQTYSGAYLIRGLQRGVVALSYLGPMKK